MKLKLIPITAHTACINGATMTTVYRLPDGGCVLLDPGHPHDVEAIDALLEQEHLPVRGILSTHMHHDHFGNCRYFAEKFGLPVILPLGEAAACRSEQALSYILGFRSSSRVGRSPSMSTVIGPVDRTIGFDQTSITVAGAVFDVIHTPGHTIDCVCFRTPDRVLVVGDILCTEESLATMRAPYTGNIAQDIASKRLIGSVECDWCVSAHHGFSPADEVPDLVEKNIAATLDIVNTVREILVRPMGIDEIIPLFCAKRGIFAPTPAHGMHIRHVVSAVLGYLLDEKEICPETQRGLTHFMPTNGTVPDEAPLYSDGTEICGR